MIPGGPTNFVTPPIVGDYTLPISLPYDPLYEVVMGGIALNDPSKATNSSSANLKYPFLT